VPKISLPDKDMVYWGESPKSPVSKTTRDSLSLLRSPDARLHPLKSPEDDISRILEPLHTYVVHFTRFHAMISREPSSNAAENFAQLQQLVIQKLPFVVASPVLKPFFGALRIEVKEMAPLTDPDEQDNISEKEIVREMLIIQEAIYFTLCCWVETFPEPPADKLLFPRDFSAHERSAIRARTKKLLEKRHKTRSDKATLEEIGKFLELLLEKWPIEKGKATSVAKAAFEEARYNHRKMMKKQEASGKTSADSVDATGPQGDLVDVDDDEDEDESDGGQDEPASGRSLRPRKPSQPFVFDDDDPVLPSSDSYEDS
jgi:hypothetical protein